MQIILALIFLLITIVLFSVRKKQFNRSSNKLIEKKLVQNIPQNVKVKCDREHKIINISWNHMPDAYMYQIIKNERYFTLSSLTDLEYTPDKIKTSIYNVSRKLSNFKDDSFEKIISPLFDNITDGNLLEIRYSIRTIIDSSGALHETKPVNITIKPYSGEECKLNKITIDLPNSDNCVFFA